MRIERVCWRSAHLVGLVMLGATGCDYVGLHQDRVPSDSIRPTLRWEPFPQGWNDASAQSSDFARRLSNVTYDIRIYRVSDGTLRYQRRALPDPIHRLEADLEAGAEYCWTVRPRFKLDGQLRVGEWSRVDTADQKGRKATQVLDLTGYARFGTPIGH